MERVGKLSEADAIRVAHMQYDRASEWQRNDGDLIRLAPRDVFVKNRVAELIVSATDGEIAMAKGQK